MKWLHTYDEHDIELNSCRRAPHKLSANGYCEICRINLSADAHRCTCGIVDDYAHAERTRTKEETTMAKIYDLGIEKAFQNFLSNEEELHAAIISSTKASWGGSRYSVELFPDGHYQVLWDGQIGNLYESPGRIIGIPALDAEEFDENDEENSFFDNAIEELNYWWKS